MTKQHLLITGAPHSGTALLANMMSRHGDIALLVGAKRLNFTRIVSKAVVGNALCVPDHIDFKDGQQQGNPFYSVRPLDRYLKFPAFRTILMLQDGREVVAAIMRAEDATAEAAAQRWCRAVTIMHELKRRLLQNALVISTAHLLAAPENSVRHCAAFLGLAYQAKMLEDWQSDLDESDWASSAPPAFDVKGSYPEIWAKYTELRAQAAGAI